MASVLITVGEQPAALAAVRSLGRAGHDVFVCAAARRSLAGSSQFVRSEAQVPDPHHAREPFVTAVRRLVERWNGNIVLPVAEISALAVLERRDSLGPVVVPFPPFERFARVCDKHFVLETAGSLGVRAPRQHTFLAPEDSAAVDVQALNFPLVIKPARSLSRTGEGR